LPDIRYDVSSAARACNTASITLVFYFNAASICDISSIYSDRRCRTRSGAGYYGESDAVFRYWNGSAFTIPCDVCVF